MGMIVRDRGASAADAKRDASPAAMSIDLEDWFQVENLRGVVPRASWRVSESRIERNTERLLVLMEDRRVHCTFFVLGWLAEFFPDLVREIAAAGHEVASHGYGHELVYHLSPRAFREDVKRSVGLLEDITGRKVRGYRAPSFSITEWAPAILRNLGLEYDSSLFPTVAHDHYGTLSAVKTSAPIIEILPGFHEILLSTLRIGRHHLPWAGGGYFRLVPYPLFAQGVRRVLASGRPYVFYLHPWEIDPAQPRLRGLKPSQAFRHYHNLHRCEQRFVRLLHDFRWTTLADLLKRHEAGEEPCPPSNEPRHRADVQQPDGPSPPAETASFRDSRCSDAAVASADDGFARASALHHGGREV
jgi:polysaccharide deacetylase family protein (PEP-CTERM system associated)